MFKVMLCLMLLFITLRLQTQLNPYKNDLINILERREILTSLATYFGALYYVSDEISEEIKLIIMIAMLLINMWFFTYMIHLYLDSSKYRFIQRISKLFKLLSLFGLTNDDSKTKL